MRSTIILAVTALTLGGCVITRSETATKAQATMIGMSSEEVLACMGVPQERAAQGATEVWGYHSGGEAITTGSSTGYGSVSPDRRSASGYAFGTSRTQNRYCVVSIVMSQGKVTRVNYSGRTGGVLTQGEQCAFAIQNCVR